MVTKLKDGRILPWKNNRLLSLDIRRRRRRRRRTETKPVMLILYYNKVPDPVRIVGAT